VSIRYVARATPGATGSRSTLDAVTAGNGAGGASDAGSVAPNARAAQHASAQAHAAGTSARNERSRVSA